MGSFIADTGKVRMQECVRVPVVLAWLAQLKDDYAMVVYLYRCDLPSKNAFSANVQI